MNKKEITTEHCGNTYNHGEIEVQKKFMDEWEVKIEANLVVNSLDYEYLHKEIQEVIRKYSI